ncbi:MAG: DUF1214 domain-containing protein [Candidatus Devosia symbiotica]|nr:DUF1214 domain-containing protein [Candidatus Devosia symbiotica]
MGFGLSYYALTDGRLFGAVQVGSWLAWPDVGAATPNPYTCGRLAREVRLQLGQAEGLRFTASVDGDEQPLTRDCSYRVKGITPLATGWTLVALDIDGRNIAAPDTDQAMRSTGLVRPNDGAIDIAVSTNLMPGNWLEWTGSGPFTLVLSLYGTAAFSGFFSDQSMPPLFGAVVHDALPALASRWPGAGRHHPHHRHSHPFPARRRHRLDQGGSTACQQHHASVARNCGRKTQSSRP